MGEESSKPSSAPTAAVFLSYASEDGEVAERIASALRAAGIEVWFDKSELRGGDVWDQKIRREVHTCALFMPVISANTASRHEGYFRLEWDLADQRTHRMARNRAFIVPVCIDDTPDSGTDVPESFRRVHWSRLPSGEMPPAFVARVSHLLSPHVSGEQPTVSDVRYPLGHKVANVSAALEKSIAVLPFTILSSDQENEYFGDGLAEEILNALSHIPELHVAARSSTFSFKNKGVDVSEIAERLRVATVLEGSVRRAADRLRITVQLVDAKTGFHLWSERYDRQLSDIFEIQDEIARAIAERLKVTLASVDTRSTANVEAYELYLRGRYEWHQRSPTKMHAAIKDFEQSLKLDPNNALAFAGLADCYAILGHFGWMPRDDVRPRAYEAMQRAVTLAPNSWETNYTCGLHIFTFDRAWRRAQPYFEDATAINPRAALGHSYLALFLALAGEAEKAIAEAELGTQLDPLSPSSHAFAATTFAIAGRLESAESVARQAIELQPDFLHGLFILGGVLCRVGRNDEAIPYLERAVQLSRAPFYVGWLGYGLARAGRVAEARRLLAELEERGSRGEFISPLARLQINTGLADIAAIRTAFATAVELWTTPLTIRFGVDLQPYRTDPEIDRLYVEVFGS